MRTPPPGVLPLFRSDLQARVLAILLLDCGEGVPTPDLARRTGAAAASLHRELHRLEDAGLIEHDRIGRTKRYRVAVSSPVHAPLRELVERTLGVEAQLRARLEALAGVEAAAIFGSWAAGRVTPSSDVDVLVVGDLVVNEPDLVVPHPRMWQRRFVLAPLADLAEGDVRQLGPL